MLLRQLWFAAAHSLFIHCSQARRLMPERSAAARRDSEAAARAAASAAVRRSSGATTQYQQGARQSVVICFIRWYANGCPALLAAYCHRQQPPALFSLRRDSRAAIFRRTLCRR